MSEQLQVVAFLTKPDFCDPYVGLHRDSMTTGTSEPLMTVAQHERIVAAKDAEIARLKSDNEKRATMDRYCMVQRRLREQAEEAFKFEKECREEVEMELNELRALVGAQPARQVGGDDLQRKAAAFVKASRKSAELEYLCAAELEDEGDADESASCANIAEQHEKAARLVEELARAALAPAAVAVVMPERKQWDASAGTAENMKSAAWNAALDEVARLNRRAIPAGLLERLVNHYIRNQGTKYEFIACITPDKASIGTGGVWDDWNELRALLGKGD